MEESIERVIGRELLGEYLNIASRHHDDQIFLQS